MQNIRRLLLLIALSAGWMVQVKAEEKKDTAYVNSLLTKSKNLFAEDPEKAITIARQAYEAAAELKFTKGEATALKNIGVGYYYQQKHVEALDYWNQSLKLFEQLKDEVGISNLLNNIGAIYQFKGEDAKALEYCLQALKLAEKTADKTRLMSSLANVASIYHNKKDAKAIDYLLKALPLCEELGDKQELSLLLGNIGEVYLSHKEDSKALSYFRKAIATDNTSANAAFSYNGIGKILLNKKDFALALENHNKALRIAEQFKDNSQKMRALIGIANLLLAQKNYPEALSYYNKARELGETINANVELKDLYKEMSLAYENIADYPNALIYKTKYADIKDTLFNLETEKKLGRLQFDFDLYKKEGEISLLTKEKSLQQAELTRQKTVRAALSVGAGLLLLFTIIIFRNYRIKVKTNKLLDNQKDEIEGLLLNILPAEVAHELKAKGEATPRNHNSASVLFSDFNGFTAIADKMPPHDLVKELNTCFMAFDNIVEKYNLEKIKTIGDSYMCAGGIPTPDDQHVYNIVKASLAMQDYVTAMNERRIQEGKAVWGLRVGIHIGPLVAGVVGKKKYAYDIWGSTVNIASRMESNGAVGKVNISAATYEMIKDRFICSYRGKIYAKNVGEIDMYFIEHEIDTTFPIKQGTVSPEPLVKDVNIKSVNSDKTL